MSKDLVYTKTQSHLYFDIYQHIIVSFTLDLVLVLKVSTGYEPHTYLTLPSTWSRHCFIKRIILKIYPNCLPQSQSWEFTIPIPHWILGFFHIEGGLLITFQVKILAHRKAEEFNSFTLRIVFRWRTERLIPPHLIEDLRIVFGYLWPNPYYQIEEDLIVHTPSRSSIVTGVTTSGTTTPVDLPSPPQELHEVPLPPAPLPKLPELPGISNFNRRVEMLCQRVEAHNR